MRYTVVSGESRVGFRNLFPALELLDLIQENGKHAYIIDAKGRRIDEV